MKRVKKPSKSRMESQILNEDMSMPDLAAYYRVSLRTIGKWREALGVTVCSRKTRGKGIRYSEIDALLEDGLHHTQAWIAKRCSCSPMTVSLHWQALHPGIRYYSARPEKRKVKPLAPRKKRAMVKPAKVVLPPAKPVPVVTVKPSAPITPGKHEGVSRGTETGFKRYWEDRPYHFGQLWPGKTIAQAWESLQGRTRSERGPARPPEVRA